MAATASDAPGNDVELDKMLVTTMLSIVLYGRQAFPENCFRKLSVLDFVDPAATHKRLLESGQRLSYRDDSLQTLSPERDTLVYLRECDDPRLHSLLGDLDQVFTALADRLLGKIYICFNDTKTWSRDSLVECFTLQFSYTKQGDLLAYAHWAGKGHPPKKVRRADTPFDSDIFFEDLKHVILTCPPLPDRFYTRLFVSPVNKQTELQGVWAENIHGIREALLGLKYKQGTSRLRIGSFIREGKSEQDAQDADQDLPDLWAGASPTLASVSSDLNAAASSTGPSSLTNPKKRPRLAMIEEIPEDLPPTQRLQTPVRSQQGSKSTFANPSCLSSDSEGSPSPGAKRKDSANLWSTEDSTQRLETPVRIQRGPNSTFANPSCLSSDSECSPSPRPEYKPSANPVSTEESPQGAPQAKSRSHDSQKAKTARVYNRSKPHGKRARTLA